MASGARQVRAEQRVGAGVSGKYRTIVADPPWPFAWQGGTGGRRANATKLGYETITVEEIAAEHGPGSVADDATLFLWATMATVHSGEAQGVARQWGFPTRTGEFIWRKPNFGTEVYPRIGHEVCMIYKRGKGSLRPDAPRNVHSVQTWSQRYENNGGKSHSSKPDAFYDHVEQGYVGPYLEMFARRARFGWDYYGDESLGTATTGEA